VYTSATMVISSHLFRRVSWLLWLSLGSGLSVQAHDGIHARLSRLDVALADQPDQPELLVRRADLHRRHDEATLAWADLRRARALPGGRDHVLIVEAELARDLGWWQLARRRIAEHLTAHPDDVDGQVLHAELLSGLGDHEAAAAAYRRALAGQASGSPELYLAASATLKAGGAGGTLAALALIEEGLGRMGSQVNMQLEAVTLLAALGRLDEALERLEELARISPRPERWLVQRGDLLWDAGQGAAARAAYLNAIRALNSGARRRSHTAAAGALREHLAARMAQFAPADATTH
jgi:tetratricopeptide (TPR) repeat protein